MPPSLALGLLCLWVIWRLGGFDLAATVQTNGSAAQVANTFARVDHPFHATRAASLLDSLRDGEILRWIGHHQGGYPVEFYPLGVAWLDVGLWALLLGSVPILSVHKLAVILIFLLPAVAYWMMSNGDRLTPWVAFLATAIHIAIPGEWTNGGYRELVDWGLVTNVGGAMLALIAAAAIARTVRDGTRAMAVVAALAVAAAAYTNPRSLIAVGISGAAILVTAILFPDPAGVVRPTAALRRVAVIGTTGLLLAGPLLLPLVRYRDLYYFVHYEGYATLRQYWDSTVTAVSLPVVILAIAGLGVAFVFQRDVVARSFAVALVAYVIMTGSLSTFASPGGIIEQLETPRLMPFQRLVMIYLAAYAIARVLERALSALGVAHRRVVTSGALLLSALGVLLLMLGPVWNPPEVWATPPIETTGRPEFHEYRMAVQAADGIKSPGTAILVIGNQLDSQRWWHEQLWGPLESDAPFFYDDWLWYWHRDHDGPYNYLNGHFYPDPQRALTEEYFRTHGIGAVVVTNVVNGGRAADPRAAASTNPALRIERTIGEWDIYRVVDPVPIVTNRTNQPVSLVVKNHLIEATFPTAEGVVTIRRNWFPRWKATADGQDIPVIRTEDGYMQVSIPPGTRELEVEYAVTNADWVARAGAVVGMITIIGTALRVNQRWRRIWQRRRTMPLREGRVAAAP